MNDCTGDNFEYTVKDLTADIEKQISVWTHIELNIENPLKATPVRATLSASTKKRWVNGASGEPTPKRKSKDFKLEKSAGKSGCSFCSGSHSSSECGQYQSRSKQRQRLITVGGFLYAFISFTFQG